MAKKTYKIKNPAQNNFDNVQEFLEYQKNDEHCQPNTLVTYEHYGDEYDNLYDLTGEPIHQTESLPGKVHLHLLTNDSVEVQRFLVLFTPLGVIFTELPVDNEFLEKISNKGYMSELGDPKTGISIGGQHDVILRWWEVEKNKIFRSGREYNDIWNTKLNWISFSQIPRSSYYKVWRWYGNSLLILNFLKLENRKRNSNSNSKESINIPGDKNFYFRKGIAWPLNYPERFSVRTIPEGTLFANQAPSFFLRNQENFYTILGYFNSSFIEKYLQGSNLSKNITNGVSYSFPVLSPDSPKGQEIGRYAQENETIVKQIWDELEVSMDYTGNPLWLRRDKNKLLKEIYDEWNEECLQRAKKIKANEEKIDRLVNEYFDVNIKKSRQVNESGFVVRTKTDAVKELISFAIGGMFGRYSGFNNRFNDRFLIVTNNSNNLDNDLVKKFIQFIGDQFGDNEENIEFVADSLYDKKSDIDPEDVIRNYLFKNFLDDSNKKFENAPIYWGISRTEPKDRKWITFIYIHDWDKKDMVHLFIEEIVPKLIEEFKTKQFTEEIEFLEKISRMPYETTDNYYVAENGVKNNYAKINESFKRYSLVLLPISKG